MNFNRLCRWHSEHATARCAINGTVTATSYRQLQAKEFGNH